MKLNEINLELIEKNIKVLKQAKENPNLIIEFRFTNRNDWVIKTTTNWEMSFLYDCEYRIKRALQYQPYKKAEEEWIGKVIYIKGQLGDITENIIVNVNKTTNIVIIQTLNNLHTTSLPYLFKEFVWGNNGDENDGKPFGDVIE